MQILLISEAGHASRRIASILRTRGETVHEDIWPDLKDNYQWSTADAVILYGRDDRVVDYVFPMRSRIGKSVLLVLAPLSHAGRIASLEYGADDCLPIDIPGQTLHHRLLSLSFLSPTAINEGHCVIGDLSVGLTSIDVWRAGRHIKLGVREYQLLRLLALKNGRTLSRGELVERVWGVESDPNDNVLDVYMHRLRGKIDKPFAKSLIQTIRGIGYRLAND